MAKRREYYEPDKHDCSESISFDSSLEDRIDDGHGCFMFSFHRFEIVDQTSGDKGIRNRSEDEREGHMPVESTEQSELTINRKNIVSE